MLCAEKEESSADARETSARACIYVIAQILSLFFFFLLPYLCIRLLESGIFSLSYLTYVPSSITHLYVLLLVSITHPIFPDCTKLKLNSSMIYNKL